MDIKMCEREGCYNPAVGTGRRPAQWCREDYLAEVGDQLVRAEVCGDVPVTDVRTGEGVRRGGVVELDPEETRIEQLVYAGAIKVQPREKSAGGPVPGESEQTLSPGEHVLTAEQVDAAGGNAAVKRLRATTRNDPGDASGQPAKKG